MRDQWVSHFTNWTSTQSSLFRMVLAMILSSDVDVGLDTKSKSLGCYNTSTF